MQLIQDYAQGLANGWRWKIELWRTRFAAAVGAATVAALLVHAPTVSAQPWRTAVILSGPRPIPQGGAGGGGGGAAPALGWVTDDGIAAGSTSATTNKGTNTINAGDVIVIHVLGEDNSLTNHSMTCPSGFTNFSWSFHYNSNSNSGFNTLACWKVAGGSETGAYTVNWTTTNGNIFEWAMYVVTGANGTAPIDVTAVTDNGNGSNTGTFNVPSVTTTGPNRLLIACASIGGSSNTYPTRPSGYTTGFTVGAASVFKLACDWKVATSAGATGGTSFTASSFADGPGWHVAFEP